MNDTDAKPMNRDQARAEYALLLEKMVTSKKQREVMLAAFLDGYDNGVRVERARLEAIKAAR